MKTDSKTAFIVNAGLMTLLGLGLLVLGLSAGFRTLTARANVLGVGIVFLIAAIGLWSRWNWGRIVAIVADGGVLLFMLVSAFTPSEDPATGFVVLGISFLIFGSSARWLWNNRALFKPAVRILSSSTAPASASPGLSPAGSAPVIPPSLAAMRSHRATPRLLILLVDKMPPDGPEAHIRRLLNDLPAQEIPEDVILRVTDSYADQGYIAANTMFTPVQQGIRADDNKTWYRSYSTADGIRGTQVFIYE